MRSWRRRRSPSLWSSSTGTTPSRQCKKVGWQQHYIVLLVSFRAWEQQDLTGASFPKLNFCCSFCDLVWNHIQRRASICFWAGYISAAQLFWFGLKWKGLFLTLIPSQFLIFMIFLWFKSCISSALGAVSHPCSSWTVCLPKKKRKKQTATPELFQNMQLCIIRRTSKGNLDLSIKLHSQWLSFSPVFFCWPLQWMNWDQWGTGNEFMHHKQHQKLAHNQPLSLMSPWFSCMACMSSELTCVTLSAEDEAVFYLTPLPFWFGLF